MTLVHNERIELLAGALNTLGLAFAIGGFVGPMIAGDFPGLLGLATRIAGFLRA